MENRRFRRSNWFLAAAITLLGILSVSGLYQLRRANALEREVQNRYVYSFYEMTDYVQDVDVLLRKTILAATPGQMAALSSEIYMQTAAAKANLAQLPVSAPDLSATSKFLSQVGDYTSYLAGKVIDEDVVTEEEYENLQKLSDYAKSVNEQLTEMQQKISAGQIHFQTDEGGAKAYAAESVSLQGGMESLEKSFQDYPSLIYDGPFSEHIETIAPAMLENRPTFTRGEAMSVARSFIGEKRAQNLSYVGEGEGAIPTYNFSAVMDDKKSEVSVSVSRQGGYVVYMLDDRVIKENNLSILQATDLAEDFLKHQGLYSMKSSYYETNGNMATINFAAVQNGVTLYSDLIKVKVALDNGDIIGYEAKGYLMSHKIRTLPEKMMTEEEARRNLSSHVDVTGAGLALIPLDSKREVLCYEFKGRYQNQNFLIYVNCETGKEEQILLLVESDQGILTV